MDQIDLGHIVYGFAGRPLLECIIGLFEQFIDGNTRTDVVWLYNTIRILMADKRKHYDTCINTKKHIT